MKKVVGFLALLFLVVGQLRAEQSELVPNPGLSPEQVVQYQMEALRRNDEPKPDAGIERSFRFSSPANRLATGPLEKFSGIVRSPAYAPMLNHLSSAISATRIEGNEAKIAVMVVTGTGRRVTYLFLLSKQGDGEFRDCWMTDAVMRLPEQETGSEAIII
jgi:Domain of unknown function (DUF4864)